MNKYLLDDRPLTVLPALAKLLGSVERAIVLQQIHWLLQQPKSGIEQDGYKWVWGTYEEWAAKYFTMWEARVLRRHIVWLEENGYLISGQPRREQWDRTKYYRIEYSRFNAESETSNLPTLVVSLVPKDVGSEVPTLVASEVPVLVGSLSTETTAETFSETPTKPLARNEFDALYRFWCDTTTRSGGGDTVSLLAVFEEWKDQIDSNGIRAAIVTAAQAKGMAATPTYLAGILRNRAKAAKSGNGTLRMYVEAEQ